MSLKWDHVIGKKPLNSMKETGKENRRRESINEKLLKLNKEIWKKNQKIIDIVDEKTFQLR